MFKYVALTLHKKLVSFTSVAPLSRSGEELIRFQHFIIFSCLGIPCMALFGYTNLHNNPAIFLLALLSGTGLIAGIIILRHINNGIWVYRINAIIFVTLIGYMVLVGGEAGSKILWVYTVPLITCFLLGTFEGVFWASLLLIVIALSFWAPLTGFFQAYDYPAAFELRFTVTYVICSIIAVWLEYSRNAYFRDSQKKTIRLEQHQLELKEEIRRRIKLENQLRELATTDSLTGILNRRAFFEQAEQELSKHQRYTEPFSFAIVDIDNFKNINDIYGHPSGDQLIKEITKVCRSCLREIDIFGRIGGEEFAIVLIKTPEQDALNITERIRNAVSALTMEHPLGTISSTISIGIYSSKGGEESIDEIYKLADTALYKAKEKGKNRVLVQSE